jgi:hypothetical protein
MSPRLGLGIIWGTPFYKQVVPMELQVRGRYRTGVYVDFVDFRGYQIGPVEQHDRVLTRCRFRANESRCLSIQA